jgi:hypothetical protein
VYRVLEDHDGAGRRIDPPVEEPEVCPPDVVLTRDSLDAKPLRGPLREWRPGLGDVLVELRRSPVGAALLDPVRGEEEDGVPEFFKVDESSGC